MRTMSFRLIGAVILGFGTLAYAAPFEQINPGGGPGLPTSGAEAANYIVDNGPVNDSVGLNSVAPNDIIWLNRFNVIPGAEVIDQVSVVYGATPALGGATNGTPAQILVYNDPNGGSTTDAILLSTTNTVVTNANTGLFNVYNLAVPVQVSNSFLVGVLLRNTTQASNPFPAGSENTPPTPAATSFIGFAAGGTLNQNNLASMGANYNAIEAFLPPMNWLVRAHGVEVPEPASLGIFGVGALALVARRRRSA